MPSLKNKALFLTRLAIIGAILLQCGITPLDMAGGASGTEVSVVSGNAVTFNGDPVSAASVTIRTVNFLCDSASSQSYLASHTVLDTVTDPNGAFVFRNVRPDTYTIMISWSDSLAAVIPLRLDSGVTAYHLPPCAVLPVSTISGSVSIYTGSVAQGSIELYGMNIKTKPDSTGYFTMKIPGGSHRIHISAYETDSNRTREFDGMDISVAVPYGERKEIGTFRLQQPFIPPCNDGSCDSMAVRRVLDALGFGNTAIGAVSVVENNRIVELSLRRLPIFNAKIPPDLLRLFAVKKLDLGHTGIGMLPPDLPKMRNLEVLRLDSNFCGMLPYDMGNLTLLKELDLSVNKLTSLPLSIVNTRPTTLLNLSGNRLANLDTTVAAWADRYDPDWRQTQAPPPPP